MTLPYTIRLVCLCLASSFLAQAAASALVASIARMASARASRMRPQSGARLLVALRLLPGAAAIFAAGALCAPSYLWLEPEAIHERVGLACLVAAAFGAGLWIVGIARVSRAALRSRRYLRTREVDAERGAPVLLLAGVVRPRLILSRAVREALSAEELDAALRHERAHAVSRDNLKRLLMVAAIAPGAAPIERVWRRIAERAADDAAVAGSPERGLALASALLKVARMAIAHPSAAIATSLLGDTSDLAGRIERLLSSAPPERPVRHWTTLAILAATAALVPAVLPGVHRALELLAR